MTKYTKSKRVYGGPFCDIYEASSPNGTVALKIVDLDFLQKPHNFRQEIALIKKLHHPGIAEYLDDYTMGEDYVLVMPFYPVDLAGVMAHFCKKRIKFNLEDPTRNKTVVKNEIPLAALKPMATKLVEALKYLHSCHIIHRDIKPANIFFRGLHDLENPALGDLGISYDVENPPVDELPAEKVGDVGTGYYKAPELCFGVTDYGYEVDLWLLGIVFSFMYSSDGNPIVKEEEVDEPEERPDLNDFVLIRGIFGKFGTPTTTPGPLCWPKLADAKYHFVKFRFDQHPRLPNSELMPRCTDEDVLRVFGGLTRYDGREFMEF